MTHDEMDTEVAYLEGDKGIAGWSEAYRDRLVKHLPWLLTLAREALAARAAPDEPPPCDMCGSPNEPSENKCEGCAKPICEDHTHYDVERIPFCEVCWDELAADGEHAEKEEAAT